ncbi:hypothetical protein [Chitinophaga nivalis]|uniref:Uncharacterized protein n=1 Tax=Chitinophaga nivalis TaxID=2991709 RepID=A0ABT3IMF4_9BACT|nr:hypothetical protein [Chitinophaga nivalis]MCW3465179.1 hypothetical protein [Chitinophaga nivalis]MCW3485129.1 hypothetical protein [Chitinophaga nivalis]
MKYLLRHLRVGLSAFLIPVVMLSACDGDGKKDDRKKETVAARKDTAQVNKVLGDTTTLSTEAYVAGIISRRQAIEKQLPGISREVAAQQYRSLALYVNTALTKMMSNEGVWLDKYASYDPATNGIPAKVQKRIDLLATAGVEPWGIGEGYTDLRIVPAFYTYLFKTSLPADYTAYLQLQADEDTVLYSADAGILIPFNAVGKRALNWEQFLDTYPNSIFVGNARELYERYCYDYLFGQDNTSSFDRVEDLSTLVPENKTEYLSFIQQHGQTKTGGIVKTFLTAVTTYQSYYELSRDIRSLITKIHSGETSLLPVQPDFQVAHIARLTKSVYDTVSLEIGGGITEKLVRSLDSVMYFQQDNQLYCVAVFSNAGKSAGAPVSGWMDVWAFKKTNDRWQTAAYLLQAGGGGMYGQAGYFDKLINMGNHTTGIVLSSGITHMGSNVSWDDVIAFNTDKLKPIINIVTQDAYDGGNGMQRCRQNRWWLQPAGQEENYNLVIIPGSCMGANVPLDRLTIPYKNGGYAIPEAFHDKGI